MRFLSYRVVSITVIVAFCGYTSIIAAQTIDQNTASSTSTDQATSTAVVPPDVSTTTPDLTTDTIASTTTDQTTSVSLLLLTPSTTTPDLTTWLASGTISIAPTMDATSTVMGIVSAATSTPSSMATSTMVHLDCAAAYVSDLYDTPSGHLDSGYTLDVAADTSALQIAHLIGSQAWEVCTDPAGGQHEYKISSDEYANLSEHDGRFPQLTVPESEIAPKSPAQTDTSTAITSPSVASSASSTVPTTADPATSTTIVPPDVSTTTPALTTDSTSSAASTTQTIINESTAASTTADQATSTTIALDEPANQAPELEANTD